MTYLAPYSQEKVDTHLLLHVTDAVQKGSKKVTVDTDVVVVAVSSFSKINPDELWVALGIGSRFRFIAINELVATWSSRQCSTQPFFSHCLRLLAEERRLPRKHGKHSQR